MQQDKKKPYLNHFLKCELDKVSNSLNAYEFQKKLFAWMP
jgi:hypothetical protein